MKLVTYLLVAIITVLIEALPCLAISGHPAEGYAPNPLPEGYGTTAWGLTSDFNYGDILLKTGFRFNQTSTFAISKKQIRNKNYIIYKISKRELGVVK